MRRPEGDLAEGSPSGNTEPTNGSTSVTAASRGGHVTDIIICTVPDCDAQAVLVLNGRPICRPHCEEFAKQASIVDGSFRDFLKAPTDEAWPLVAGPLPIGLDVVGDASTSDVANGPDPTD